MGPSSNYARFFKRQFSNPFETISCTPFCLRASIFLVFLEDIYAKVNLILFLYIVAVARPLLLRPFDFISCCIERKIGEDGAVFANYTGGLIK